LLLPFPAGLEVAADAPALSVPLGVAESELPLGVAVAEALLISDEASSGLMVFVVMTVPEVLVGDPSVDEPSPEDPELPEVRSI
jgi:hypothetical protein